MHWSYGPEVRQNHHYLFLVSLYLPADPQNHDNFSFPRPHFPESDHRTGLPPTAWNHPDLRSSSGRYRIPEKTHILQPSYCLDLQNILMCKYHNQDFLRSSLQHHVPGNLQLLENKRYPAKWDPNEAEKNPYP